MKYTYELPEEYKDLGEKVRELPVLFLYPNKVKKVKSIDDVPSEVTEMFNGAYADNIEGRDVIVFEHKDLLKPENYKKLTDAGIRLHSASDRG